MRGKIIRIDKAVAEVHSPQGVFRCALRGKYKKGPREARNVVAVGDNVVFSRTSEAEGVIEEVLERSSRISRPDILNPKIEHVLLANLDIVVVVASIDDPPLNAGLVDRYIASVLAHELQLLLVFNKSDLAMDDETRMIIEEYRSMGIDLLLTSCNTGEGIEQLRARLAGRTSVFTGMSGVGKSSLIAKLIPGYVPRVAEVSDKTGKGKHTTTFVTLLRSEDGGYIADTPGLKLFGIWGVPRDELAFFFPDIAPFKSECRFNNCLHRIEPGCAVREAVENGKISRRRYNSYLQILKDLIEMEETIDPHMRRDKLLNDMI
ncbi:MAG: ribosome small subunit-dependent GTPase A [Planctomycetota bacterium]